MKALILSLALLLTSLSTHASRADSQAQLIPMAGNLMTLKFTGPIVAKITRDLNTIRPDRHGHRKGRHITCLSKVCVIGISDKTTGALQPRPQVNSSKFYNFTGQAIAYDFVGTRTQSNIVVYGAVAEKLFTDMGQATIEWRMTSNGSMQKVGQRYSCDKTVSTQPRRTVQFSCNFFVEDRAIGKISSGPMG